MEHILHIGINVDDDVIRKRIEDKAEQQIIDSLRDDVINHIFDLRYHASVRHADFSDFAKDVIRECFDEHKEEIIKMAAEHLADRFVRTKTAKEYLGDVLKDSK